MKILSIEIIGSTAGVLLIEGNKENFSVNNLGKVLALPKEATIKDIIEFKTNFSILLKKHTIDELVLCEGGNESKKMRTRMEFVVLSECESNAVVYNTYPTGSCTRLINSSYKKDTGREFTDDLKTYKLPKYMGKTFVAGWRFLK